MAIANYQGNVSFLSGAKKRDIQDVYQFQRKGRVWDRIDSMKVKGWYSSMKNTPDERFKELYKDGVSE